MSIHRTVVINQDLFTASSFTLNTLQQGITFIPDKVIIRQLIYANISGTDSGTYLIWSSITSANIAAVYVGVQSAPTTPNTEISLPSSNYQSIDFRVVRGSGAYAVPSGLLTMVLEFVKDRS